MSDVLDTLFDTILDRQTHPRPGSYTARLLEAGEDKVLKKVGEEAMEVILAAKGQGDERLISEVADVFYHLLVLLAARGLSLRDVEAELVRRRSPEPVEGREPEPVEGREPEPVEGRE
ncbi:MAG: phosphoribosyl-ATP diphosphatase, partial [Anaerolineae bacterium]